VPTSFFLDEVLRKALWLKIAVFAIEDHKTIKPAIEIMKESDCLKIEDILPHFPDFVVIDDFKEDICSALEEYHSFILFCVQFSTDSWSCVAGTAGTLMDYVAVWMKRLSAQTASARCAQRCVWTFFQSFPLVRYRTFANCVSRPPI